MKQQIRYGTFETNSSSTHSLTMGTGKLVAQPFDKDILRAGVVKVHPGEYGWEFYRYYTPREKLNYLVSQALGNGRMVSHGTTQELLEESPKLAMLAKVVKEYTGCDIEIVKGQPSIDHDSLGVGHELYETESTLKKFLFDETAFIQTGNDNSPCPRIISTDKGDADLYAERVSETVPKSYVGLMLRLLSEPPFHDGFAGPTGAVIVKGSELFKKLCSKMIVESATLQEWRGHRVDSDRTVADKVANTLLGNPERFPGLRIRSNFYARTSFKNSKGGHREKERVMLFAWLPEKLANEFKALPPGEVCTIELKQARRMLKFWKVRLQEELAKGTPEASLKWEKTQIESYEGYVNELTRERRTLQRHTAFPEGVPRSGDASQKAKTPRKAAK